jgi:hypothetical protein
MDYIPMFFFNIIIIGFDNAAIDYLKSSLIKKLEWQI